MHPARDRAASNASTRATTATRARPAGALGMFSARAAVGALALLLVTGSALVLTVAGSALLLTGCERGDAEPGDRVGGDRPGASASSGAGAGGRFNRWDDRLGVSDRYASPDRDLDALVATGEDAMRRAYTGQACIACHDIAGSRSTVGPSLRQIGARAMGAADGDGLRARVWLHHKIAQPDTTLSVVGTMGYARGSMPGLRGPADAIEAMVEYLMTLGREAEAARERADGRSGSDE